MNINVNFKNTNEVYNLYILLGNAISDLENENFTHSDMVKLLDGGSPSNVQAQRRYIFERECIEQNNKKIEIYKHLREQLHPFINGE